MEIILLGIFLLIAFALFAISTMHNFNAPLIGAFFILFFLGLEVLTSGYQTAGTLTSNTINYTSTTPMIVNSTTSQILYRTQDNFSFALGLILIGMAVTAGILAIRPQEYQPIDGL